MQSFDLVVVGGGPGGYPAAIRAAQRGLSVCLIDRDGLGGTCLHRGCIPSKAYIAAAEMIAMAKRAEAIGVRFSPPEIDFAKLVRGKDGKVKKLADGIAGLLKGHKIETISGEAHLQSATAVEVGRETFEGKFILLATGTEPVRPGFLPFDGKKVLTTDELFRLTSLPKRMVVIGGGVIGCEIACAFNLLGSGVVVVEMLPDLLPMEGGIVSRTIRSIFERRGILVKTGTKVEKVEGLSPVRVTLAGGDSIETDLVLAAIGRRVGEDRLGLAKIEVAIENGFVKVNERMETTVENVYAVGDLAGKTMLAHGATTEGIAAVEHIAGIDCPVDYDSIPRVTYTIPEVASIGVKDSKKAGRFSYLANGMAMLHEETEGFAEIYIDEDDTVKGATIVGAHAADLIQEVALVMKNRLKVDALIETVHAHPTISEIIHEAAEDTRGMAIHKVGRR